MSALKVVNIPSVTLRLATEELSDEKMAEIGKKAAGDVLLRDLPLEVSGTMTTESVLETMKLLYEVHESEFDGKKVVFLAHYSGAKWSVFAGTFWKAIFASAGENRILG